MSLIYLYFVVAILVAIIATLRGRMWWRWLLIAIFITPLVAGLLVMALPPEPRRRPEELPPAPLEGGETTPADSTLRVIRMSGYHDRYRPYEFFVNGVRVGTVAHDSVVDFQVPHGELVVEARTSRGGSRPLLIETAPGQRTDIYVARHGGHLRALYADLFGSANYLIMRQRPGYR